MTSGVDLRGGAPVVKDQGRRGTCVACAATVAHEMIRAEGIALSIEFLHWACKQRDGLPAMAEGTTLVAAKDALDQDGQPPELTWPYDDARDQWDASYTPPSPATIEAKHRLLAGGEAILSTAAALRVSLDRARPVVLGVRLHATWHGVGADGRVAMPAGGVFDLGGHAILVVGYRADGFIVQNSWGDDWGENGFAYLPDDYVDRFAVAAWSLWL